MWKCGDTQGISLEKLFVINYSNNFKRLVCMSLSLSLTHAHTHTDTHNVCVPEEPDIIQTFS